jgi:hypothetical protein
VITYRATLDVPWELVAYVSGLLRAQRRALGTRKGTRILTTWRQAVFGLVWFRNRGVDIPQLGAGFGLSRAAGRGRRLVARDPGWQGRRQQPVRAENHLLDALAAPSVYDEAREHALGALYAAASRGYPR